MGLLGKKRMVPEEMFKAFRTVPVILEIVEDMKRLCPNAWLVNFTNPSGMVTRRLLSNMVNGIKLLVYVMYLSLAVKWLGKL